MTGVSTPASLWLDVLLALVDLFQPIAQPKVRSVGLGVRNPTNLDGSLFPYVDVACDAEVNSYLPAEVVDSKRNVILIGASRGQNVAEAEQLLAAMKGKVAGDNTLGGLVIDMVIRSVQVDHDLWPDTVYQSTLEVHFEHAFGLG